MVLTLIAVARIVLLNTYFWKSIFLTKYNVNLLRALNKTLSVFSQAKNWVWKDHVNSVMPTTSKTCFTLFWNAMPTEIFASNKLKIISIFPQVWSNLYNYYNLQVNSHLKTKSVNSKVYFDLLLNLILFYSAFPAMNYCQYTGCTEYSIALFCTVLYFFLNCILCDL